MRILGIDYGDARVGIAITDSLGITAQGLETIHHKGNDKVVLKRLEEIDEEGGNNEEGIRQTLMDAERLKLNMINTYVKYLGNTYQSLSMKKIQLIVNQLRIKLYNCINNRKKSIDMNELFYLEEDEYRGRRR